MWGKTRGGDKREPEVKGVKGERRDMTVGFLGDSDGKGQRTPSWGRGSLTEEQKGWAVESWSLVPHLTGGLGQICHSGSLHTLSATSSHMPPSRARLECASLSLAGMPLFASSDETA